MELKQIGRGGAMRRERRDRRLDDRSQFSRELGGSIVQDGVPPKGRVTKMHGVIRDITTGKPIPGAVFDIWQANLPAPSPASSIRSTSASACAVSCMPPT